LYSLCFSSFDRQLLSAGGKYFGGVLDSRGRFFLWLHSRMARAEGSGSHTARGAKELQESAPSWKSGFRLNFGDFYHNVSKPFWLYILRVCGDESLADEIFQESFLRFLTKAPDHLNEQQMKSYLYRIAARLFIDHIRLIKKEGYSIPEESPDHKAAPEKTARLDMENVFLHLNPRERNLLWLAYVEGYEHREIGEILGVGEKSIRVMLFRVRKRLAALLVQRGYAPEPDLLNGWKEGVPSSREEKND
jgi:RNA polymerase sigma-70 factor (ECF subfamily)